MAANLFTSDLGFEIPSDAVIKLQKDAREARDNAKRFNLLADDRERKLEAIRQLAPHLFDEPVGRVPNLEEGDESNAVSKSLIDAVVRAVDRSSRPLSPKDIREAIREQGDGALMTNDNYLYTAIKRAADGGRIDRQDNNYVSAL